MVDFNATRPSSSSPARDPWSVLDLSDPEGLIRFALKSQLHRLGIAQKTAAKGMRMQPSQLSRFMTGSAPVRLSEDALKRADQLLAAEAVRRGVPAPGGLRTFAEGVRGTTNPVMPVATIPASWTSDVLSQASDDALHILVQAASLLDMFLLYNEVGLSSGQLRCQRRTTLRQAPAWAVDNETASAGDSETAITRSACAARRRRLRSCAGHGPYRTCR